MAILEYIRGDITQMEEIQVAISLQAQEIRTFFCIVSESFV
jgi:hypothetical protein